MNINKLIEDFKQGKIVVEHEEEYDFENGSFDEYIKINKASMIRTAWHVFVMPILIIHEAYHVVSAIIIGHSIMNINFGSIKSKYYSMSVHYKQPFCDKFYKEAILSLSPALAILFVIVLTIYNPIFWPLLIYFIIGIRYTLSSKTDVMRVVLHPYKLQFANLDEYMRFAAYCINNISLWKLLISR